MNTEVYAGNITRADMIAAIERVTAEVFGTMLAIEVAPGAAFHEQNVPGPSEGVVGLIGLTGPWVGTGVVHCNSALACQIASAMMMQEYTGICDDVLDSVGEVTNMVVGNIKTYLEEHLGPKGLSVPSVIYGRNFSSRTMSRNEWTVVPFKVGAEGHDVQIALTLSEAQAPMHRPGLHRPVMVGTPHQAEAN